MTMISAIGNGVLEARINALEAEFGVILAGRIMESEAVDFLWEARVKERYLGQHFDICFPPDGDDVELSRVAILSLLKGQWHVAVCLVDGEGRAVDLLWKQAFHDRAEAGWAYAMRC